MGTSLLQLRPSCPPDDLPKSTELSAFLLYPEPTGSSTPAGRPPTAQAPSASSTSALHLRPKFLTSWSDSYQGRDPPPHPIFRRTGQVGAGRVELSWSCGEGHEDGWCSSWWRFGVELNVKKRDTFFAAALVVVHQETAFAAATVYLNF
jgi:hypothetical protein